MSVPKRFKKKVQKITKNYSHKVFIKTSTIVKLSIYSNYLNPKKFI
jgi:hypothetical protein